MIKIRLHGTKAEIEKAKAELRVLFHVLYESEPYKDRGKSQYYRCYMDCEVDDFDSGETISGQAKWNVKGQWKI